MFKLASMFVEIKADQGGFEKVMDNVQARLTRANVAAGTFAGNIATMFARAAAGLVVGSFDKTIKAASTLGETMSKVKTVFGNAADVVIKQSEDMARTFGLPKQEMLDAQAIFGILAKSAGQGAAEAATFSNQMVKLAADMSSFHNIPLADALQKIRSGLSGEIEPLRSVGVFLREDAVAAEAVAIGLIKNKNALDEGAKIMARASLISKGLVTSQGDLERTLSGTENQTRKFWGTLSNLATDIGTQLLPAFDQVLAIANSTASALADGWSASKGAFDSLVESVVGQIDTAALVLRNFSDVWSLVQLNATEAVANVVSYFQTLGEDIVYIATYIADNWYKLISDAINAVGTVMVNAAKNFHNLGMSAVQSLLNPAAATGFQWTPMLEGFTATAEKMRDAAKPVWVSMQRERDEILGRIGQREAKRLDDVAKKAQKIAKPVQDVTTRKNEAFKSVVVTASDFSEKLRAAQLNDASDVPQQQLEEAKKANEINNKVLDAVKKPRVAVLG